MNSEIQSLTKNIREVLSGQPWYGKSMNAIFETVDERNVYKLPSQNAHSLAELLYHMNTWAAFTLAQIANKKIDMEVLDKTDWIEINPEEHQWEKGVKQFNAIHEEIIDELQNKEDDFLNSPARHRDYDFRYLLNGLIQHDIYHLGQIAYLNKGFY